MGNPHVSIIIPTYNREKLIINALDSIFNQTFKDYEILIIDDASTDNTEQVIKELNHPKVKYLKLEKNSGQCIARNFGAKRAQGKFIAFLDSDDEWLPKKLESQLKIFNEGSDRLGAVYGYSYQKDVIKDETGLSDSGYFRGDIFGEVLTGFCPPTPSLFVVKRSAFESVSGFDESLVTFVDLDLWLRISEKYDFDYVEEPVIIKYEQIGDQYINNFDKRYLGYHLFMKKWSQFIEQKKGKKGLLYFKRSLVYKLVFPFLDHPPADLRKNITKLMGLLVKVRSTKCRLYLKSFMILIFGPSIIHRIRKIRG